MKKYDVTITETLQRTVTVKAANAQQAEELVRKDYENCCIEVKEITGIQYQVKPCREKESHER